MSFLNPSDYGFTASDSELYVAIAVMDFIDQTKPEDIHLTGKMSKEYVGMLCTYAIARALTMLKENPENYKLMKMAADNFDSLNISAKLIEYIKTVVNGYSF